MAQLDANIFLQQQGPDLNKLSEGFERGIRLGDLMKQRKIEEQARMDKKPLEDQKQALEMQRSQAELIANAALGSKDQASYTNNLNSLRQRGIDLTGVPDIYDPGLVQQYGGMALSAKERIENQLNKENMALRREDQSLDRQYKYAQLQGAREDRQNALVAKTAEKQDKKNAAVTEIQDRYLNMKSEINNLAGLIDENGTYDLTGPQNEIIDQKITSIATDMAKLVDPTSVARESEVAAFKKMLFKPTPFIQNSTAKDVLKSFEKMVDDRLSTAYKVRGLENTEAVVEKTNQQNKAPKMGQEEQGFIFLGGDPANPKSWKKK